MSNVTEGGEGSEQVTLWQVFSNRNFALLWVGQVVAYLGDNIFKMAIVAIVTFGLTSQDDKAVQQNWVTILGNVPYFIFPLFFASLIDRSDRRNLLIWMDVYRAVLIGFCAFLVSSDSPRAFAFGLVFLVYAGTSVFYPAKSLFITEIVRPGHLLRANSVSTTIGSLMALFGTLIGTRLVEAFGYKTTLLITAGAYLFSMVTLLLINKERQGQVRSAEEQKVASERKSEGAIADLADGWRATRTNPIALSSVLMFGWIWGVVGAFFALLTAIIYARLAPAMGRIGDEAALNLQGEVLGLVGVSLFAGGVIVGRLANRISLPRLLSFAFIGAGVSIAGLAIPGVLDNPWLALPLIFVLGSFGGAILIPVETSIGKGVAREVRGRVFAFNTIFHTVLLTGMLSLTNIYLDFYKDFAYRLEVGLIATGLVAIAGALLTRILPRGIVLATMTPESASMGATVR
jgi:MFS family permease